MRTERRSIEISLKKEEEERKKMRKGKRRRKEKVICRRRKLGEGNLKKERKFEEKENEMCR